MIYRTGGNEIIQAPLTIDMPIYDDRKAYWRDAINGSIDYLITNSEFTEKRLLDFGIKPSILRRIAGGVDRDTVVEAVANAPKLERNMALMTMTFCVLVAQDSFLIRDTIF